MESAGPIYSQFRDDPDFRELLEQFIGSVHDRRADLATAFAAEDLTEVARQAHQIKGAGGGYGYASLSQAAARLEAACRVPNPNIDTIGPFLEEVLDQLNRVSV